MVFRTSVAILAGFAVQLAFAAKPNDQCSYNPKGNYACDSTDVTRFLQCTPGLFYSPIKCPNSAGVQLVCDPSILVSQPTWSPCNYPSVPPPPTTSSTVAPSPSPSPAAPFTPAPFVRNIDDYEARVIFVLEQLLSYPNALGVPKPIVDCLQCANGGNYNATYSASPADAYGLCNAVRFSPGMNSPQCSQLCPAAVQSAIDDAKDPFHLQAGCYLLVGNNLINSYLIEPAEQAMWQDFYYKNLMSANSCAMTCNAQVYPGEPILYSTNTTGNANTLVIVQYCADRQYNQTCSGNANCTAAQNATIQAWYTHFNNDICPALNKLSIPPVSAARAYALKNLQESPDCSRCLLKSYADQSPYFSAPTPAGPILSSHVTPYCAYGAASAWGIGSNLGKLDFFTTQSLAACGAVCLGTPTGPAPGFTVLKQSTACNDIILDNIAHTPSNVVNQYASDFAAFINGLPSHTVPGAKTQCGFFTQTYGVPDLEYSYDAFLSNADGAASDLTTFCKAFTLVSYFDPLANGTVGVQFSSGCDSSVKTEFAKWGSICVQNFWNDH